MRLIGATDQQRAKVATRDRPFRINEFLVVDDGAAGVLVEVVATFAVNPLLPDSTRGPGLIDEAALGTLQALGYSPLNENFYLAEVRVTSELSCPLAVGAKVRPAVFEEVRHLLLPEDTGRSALLGVVRGTEEFVLPQDLRDTVYRYLPRGDCTENLEGVPFFLDWVQFSQYPHIGIFGGSGSGKSFALRVLVEELVRQGLPAVVFDPHFELSFEQPLVLNELFIEKKEELTGRYTVFTLGQNVSVKFEELSRSDLVTLLRSVMEGWTEQMEHATRILWRSGDSFESFRWRLTTLADALSQKNRYDRALEGLEKGEDVVARFFPDDPVRQEEFRSRLETYREYRDSGVAEATAYAVLRRLSYMVHGNLIGQQGTEVLEETLKQGKTCIVRGETRNLGIFATYAVRKLFGLRRRYRDSLQYGTGRESFFPPFFVVTDEAHTLAPKPRGEKDHSPARAIVREISQEGRKYGVFLILATQRPALLDDTVNAQLNTKIILRTVRAQDLDAVSRETDIGPHEVARLPYLSSGNAFVSSAIIGRTVPITVRASWTRSPHSESPFAEWQRYLTTVGEDLWPAVRVFLSANKGFLAEPDIAACLNHCQGMMDRRVTESELRRVLERWAAEGRLEARPSKAFGGVRWLIK
ncbi:MAG: ATP-binding protein [Bacillota bacterium]